jgi:hypothetical protein
MDQSNAIITSSFGFTQYPQLMSLMIGNSSLSMTDFQELLSLTPSLVRLKLISYRSSLDSILNGSDWAHLIQTKLSDLKTFQIFFSYTLRHGNDVKDLDLLIDRFRTPFWLQEKKWIITCDYVLKQNLINFYTTQICNKDFQEQSQSVKTKYQSLSFIIRFKLLSMDNEFHPTVRLIYGNDDITESQVCRKTLMRKQSLLFLC